jgi:hypothetical protein
MNEIIAKWSQINTKGITLSTSTNVKTLLFADDQDIIAYSEDNLERGVFTLQIIAKNVGMELRPEKYEMMAFLRQGQ